MTIEIHKPELEDLIAHGMQTGNYSSVEEYLLCALSGKPLQEDRITLKGPAFPSNATGILLVAALQECPYPEMPLIRDSVYLEVRDVKL